MEEFNIVRTSKTYRTIGEIRTCPNGIDFGGYPGYKMIKTSLGVRLI
jgi:hypothetical protein